MDPVIFFKAELQQIFGIRKPVILAGAVEDDGYQPASVFLRKCHHAVSGLLNGTSVQTLRKLQQKMFLIRITLILIVFLSAPFQRNYVMEH